MVLRKIIQLIIGIILSILGVPSEQNIIILICNSFMQNDLIEINICPSINILFFVIGIVFIAEVLAELGILRKSI